MDEGLAVGGAPPTAPTVLSALREVYPGEVAFAGSVPGGRAVTISHPGGLQTTYSLHAATYVAPGDPVARGRWIGTSAQSHPGAGAGLHFGVKLEGAGPKLETIRFLSDVIYRDEEEFGRELCSGKFRERLKELLEKRRQE